MADAWEPKAHKYDPFLKKISLMKFQGQNIEVVVETRMIAYEKTNHQLRNRFSLKLILSPLEVILGQNGRL